jgi:thiamine phosphate synthase YjbQ (UPF0047 family)
MPTVHRLEVPTHARCELVDVTDQVRAVITRSGHKSGLCVVFSPHTTAGVTVQENSDPDVQHDSHIKTSLMGSSTTLIVEDGKPVLGHWQAVYLCEFDGPRTRTLHIRVL